MSLAFINELSIHASARSHESSYLACFHAFVLSREKTNCRDSKGCLMGSRAWRPYAGSPDSIVVSGRDGSVSGSDWLRGHIVLHKGVVNRFL